MDSNGVQLDCELGRLEKFAKNGATIMSEQSWISLHNDAIQLTLLDDDAVKEIVELSNDGKAYKVVYGRFCSAFRPQEWADLQSNTLSVFDEIRLDIEAIVYVDDDISEEDVIKTIDSIEADSYKVPALTVINNGTQKVLKNVLTRLRASKFKAWKINNLPKKMSRQRALDCTILPKNVKSGTYLIIMDGGTELSDNMPSMMNYRINYLLEPVVLVDDGKCVFTMGAIYRSVDGNIGDVGYVEAIRQCISESSPYKVEINESRATSCINSDS